MHRTLHVQPSHLIINRIQRTRTLSLLMTVGDNVPSTTALRTGSTHRTIAGLYALPLLTNRGVTTSFIIPAITNYISLIVRATALHSNHQQVQRVTTLPKQIRTNIIRVTSVCSLQNNILHQNGNFPPRTSHFRTTKVSLNRILNPTSLKRIT